MKSGTGSESPSSVRVATAMPPRAALPATLITLALNMLALHGRQSMRAGLAAVAHDIDKLLAMD